MLRDRETASSAFDTGCMSCVIPYIEGTLSGREASPAARRHSASDTVARAVFKDVCIQVREQLTTDEARKVGLSIGGSPGQAEVLFEGRILDVSDEGWRDTFGPYERHVYRLR